MNVRSILNEQDILSALSNNEKYLFEEIPELKIMKKFDQKHPHHHLDLWEHTKLALSISPNDEIIRMALLLHDIGKPYVYKEIDGIRHYQNHAKVSSDISYQILKKLNFNEDEIKLITFLILFHDTKITEENIKENYNLYYLLYKVQYCDALAHNPNYLEKRIKYLEDLKKIFETYSDNIQMDNLTMIAATGLNNELGKNNSLIWHLKGDLQFFKQQTMGKKIIMGYNTFVSLPQPLKGREHLVLTHKQIDLGSDIKVYHSKQELLKSLKDLKEQLFVIGGASIYKEFMPNATKLLLTEIEQEDIEADAYFPTFNKEKWKREVLAKKEDNGIKYSHVLYKRKVNL